MATALLRSPSSGEAAAESSVRHLVRIEGLHKHFGSLEVLRGIDLDVTAGQKVSLIGPSGSGKTTLLRCINYLERPTKGHIYIDGVAIGAKPGPSGNVPMRRQELALLRASIGMVFQRFNLFPHLTALENVTIGPLRVSRRPRRDVEAEALALLEKVGMAEKRHEYPDRLSGGQQQRVAIARALAMRPKLMLFDEATSALDPELVGEVLTVMRSLAAEGMTMIIVTHEMRFAESVSDEVVFMAEGSIVERGPPAQVFRASQTARTREFLRAVLDT